jgi:inositol-hexakisphosphate 5-kinase
VKDRACPPQHPNEPDRGFLRGLRNLRKYFLKIQNEIVEMEHGRGVDIEVDGGKAHIKNGSIYENGNSTMAGANGLEEEDLGEVSY